MEISNRCRHGLAQAHGRASSESHGKERRPPTLETKLFSATDYAVRFAQVFAQILLLLVIILLITRMPEFFTSMTGVEIRLILERQGDPDPSGILQPHPAESPASPPKEGW